MFFDRLRYESKLLWKQFFLLPLLTVVLFTLFVYLQTILHEDPARTLLSEAEVFLPLVAGMTVGTFTIQEPSLELHLTLPSTYRRTIFLRLAILVGTTAIVSCIFLSILTAMGYWYLPPFLLSGPQIMQWLIIQLIWIAPLLWFVGISLVLSVLLKSSVLSGSVLAGIWLMELVLWDPFLHNPWLRSQYLFSTTMFIYQGKGVALPASFFNAVWLIPRFELIGTALVLLLLGWFLLQNTERLLKGASAE